MTRAWVEVLVDRYRARRLRSKGSRNAKPGQPYYPQSFRQSEAHIARRKKAAIKPMSLPTATRDSKDRGVVTPATEVQGGHVQIEGSAYGLQERLAPTAGEMAWNPEHGLHMGRRYVLY